MATTATWTSTRVIRTVGLTFAGAIVMWAFLPITYWFAATVILAGFVFGKDNLKAAGVAARKLVSGLVIFGILRFIGTAISGVALSASEAALRTKGWEAILWAGSAEKTLAFEVVFAVVTGFMVWRAFSATSGFWRGLCRFAIGGTILASLAILITMNARPTTATAAYYALPTEPETTAAAKAVGNTWREWFKGRRVECGGNSADALSKQEEEVIVQGDCDETRLQTRLQPGLLHAEWLDEINHATFYCADGTTTVVPNRPGTETRISCPELKAVSFNTKGLPDARVRVRLR